MRSGHRRSAGTDSPGGWLGRGARHPVCRCPERHCPGAGLCHRMLYLLLLLGSSPILSGYFPLHFLHREEVPDSNQLKLVCWNAEGFRLNKDTLAKAAHSIRILQPGIVCLQERPHTNLLAWDTIQALFPITPIASSTRGRMKFLIWPSSAAGLSETFKSTTSRTATIRCFKRISG